MKRLTNNDIFKEGNKGRTDMVDFDKEPELKKLFEDTKRRQEEIIELQNAAFENIVITI